MIAFIQYILQLPNIMNFALFSKTFQEIVIGSEILFYFNRNKFFMSVFYCLQKGNKGKSFRFVQQ